MRWDGRLASVLLGVATLLGSSSAQAAWVRLEPADGGFSVFFPATATLTTKEEPGGVTRMWTARVGKIVCRIGMLDYNRHIYAEQELEADMTNFLKALG